MGYIIAGIWRRRRAKVASGHHAGEGAAPTRKSSRRCLPVCIRPRCFAACTEHDALRDALEKLQLNDAQLHLSSSEVSQALGFAFAVASGLLHMEIVQERWNASLTRI